MLVSANVALAAEVGNPIIVDKTNMFTADETVDLLGGDLGEAANFGLVGFDSIHLNAHTTATSPPNTPTSEQPSAIMPTAWTSRKSATWTRLTATST